MRKIIVGLALFSLFNINALAGEFVNGSFEIYDVNHGDFLHVNVNSTESDQGWVVGALEPTSGEFLEVRNNFFGVAQEGTNFAELTPGEASSISQTFNLDATTEGSISWWYRPRSAFGSHNNYDVTLFDDTSNIVNYEYREVPHFSNTHLNDWNQIIFNDLTFAADKKYTLTFTSRWSSDNTPLTTSENDLALGANIDNIVISSSAQVAAVPEPETYLMFLAGLGLLGFASRKRKA